MKNACFVQAFVAFVPRASARIAGSIGLAALLMASSGAQQANPSKDKDTTKSSYDIHQSFDMGGHIVNQSGSGAMYGTLVNLSSGPRILNHTLEVHATPGPKHLLFDTLYSGSTGYGGDPNSFSTLRMSRGKAYDFVGSFRRDRQYFDYNLFGNPLVPGGATAPVSNGYVFPQIQDAAHLFNTVRRMTDLNLTILPVSTWSFRASYTLNVNQGPSLSSIHQGADALLLQNWRNSSNIYLGAVDWKPFARTRLTYEQHVTQYKGDTSWSLTGLNMQLPNGTPVTLGFDDVAGVGAVSATSGCTGYAGKPAVLNSTTNPPTANPCVNGYMGYSRSQPTRTLFPTEEFRFQTADIKNVQMNGRILYTGASTKISNYGETFSGMESRVLTPIAVLPSASPAPAAYCTKVVNNTTHQTTYNDCHVGMAIAGSVKAQRINVSADFGLVWQVTKEFAISDQYDFQDWRQPAVGEWSTVDQYAASMIATPAVTTAPSLSDAANSLGQKTQTNTLVGEWEAASWVQVSLGYRYRSRTLNLGRSEATEAVTAPALLTYGLDIHENTGLLGLVLRPTREWRINSTIETGWADAAYVQTSPRQLQHYQVRTTYRPKSWATVSGAYNDWEKRDSTFNVGYLAHSRSFGGNASLAPSERYSLDLGYGYIDVFSKSVDCFGVPFGVAVSGTTQLPIGAVCGNITSTANPAATTVEPFYGNSYYDAPTQYGSVGFVLTPIKAMQAAGGYRVTSVDGNSQLLHPLAVEGSLQSMYQSPYADLSWKFTKGWGLRGDWNYYGYGEEGAAGPTAPRNFHGNVVTLGVHYEY